MPKSKQQKQEISRDLAVRFGKATSVVFTSFNGLGVKDNELLRSALVAKIVNTMSQKDSFKACFRRNEG